MSPKPFTMQSNNTFELSKKDKEFYERNGYLIIRDFFDTKTCDNLKQAAKKYAKENIHNYLNFHRDIKEFQQLILHPALHDVCDQINNKRMIPIGSIFFFGKPKNDLENGSHPHQDNYAAKAPQGSYLVASLALDFASEENGALYLYPGSNKLPELPFIESKNFDFNEEGELIKNYPIGNEVQVPKGYEKKILEYSPGDLILMHSNTIHGAEKNISISNKWRNQFYMHFIREGDPFWPGWNAKRQIMDRGPKRI